MRYDALNRSVKKKTPLELDEAGNIVYSIESYTYDEANNLLTKVQTGTKDTLSKRETVYTYYDNNQIRTQSGNDGSSAEYFYDNNGNLTKKKILQDMVDGAARYNIEKYSYDGMNRMTESIRLVDAEDVYKASGILNIEELKDSEYAGKIKLITGYTYDILGNKLSEISPAMALSPMILQIGTNIPYGMSMMH